MRTKELLATSLLAAAFLAGCTATEEPVMENSGEAIRLTAGIGKTTRAVIDAGHTSDLNISFARIDNPSTASTWNASAVDAVRAGGTGNTAITFSTEQNYLTEDGESALIGYYPSKALEAGISNPVTVKYTITGDEDIMTTEIQTGKLTDPFGAFTFQHLLTQLQFRCTGSAEAITQWTAVASLTVKNIATGLTLSLDKTGGASLTASGAAGQSLAVKNCPSVVSKADVENPTTGYLMLFPAANMGTVLAAISLEVKAMYGGAEKTQTVAINNIDGGAKAGQSHLITLTFSEDGTITAEAGIAAWQPGNVGSSVITPGN